MGYRVEFDVERRICHCMLLVVVVLFELPFAFSFHHPSLSLTHDPSSPLTPPPFLQTLMRELVKRKTSLSSISEQLQPIAVILSPEKNLSLRDLLQQVEKNQQCLTEIEKGLKAIEIASRFKSRPPPSQQNHTSSTTTTAVGEGSGGGRFTSPPQLEDSKALALRGSGVRPPAAQGPSNCLPSSSSSALDRSTSPASAPMLNGGTTPASTAPTSSNHTGAAQGKTSGNSPRTTHSSEAPQLYSTIVSSGTAPDASSGQQDGVDGEDGVLAADGVVVYDHLTEEPPPSPLVQSEQVYTCTFTCGL